MNIDLGNSVYFFSLNSKECELEIFVSVIFLFKHKGCVLFLPTKNTSQSGDNYGFVILSGEQRPILRTCQSANKAPCCPDGLWTWRGDDRGWGLQAQAGPGGHFRRVGPLWTRG